MSDRIYALLVGIDEYPRTVGALTGCVNDVEHLHEHLQTSGDPRALAVETLTNGQATRAAVVDAFRRHLGQVREGDVALFHYSGHGARWASAPAFKPWYPDGKDESLVCIDSRARDGYDLADKELAVLVHEVAARGAHVAVLLDCCHSGSGTRGADTLRGLRARVTHEVLDPRPLDSYLDGWYAERAARGETLSIPTGSHILLAACERGQLAQETPDGHGVFTATLLDVLRKTPAPISYAELFVRCRAAVRRRADDQTPQFETYARFNAWSGFLGRAGVAAARRYSAAFEGGAWKVDAGALHGLPADPDKVTELLLYRELDPMQPVGSATTTEVGPQKSQLALGFTSTEDERYSAVITSLPVPPLPIAVQAEAAGQQEVADALATDASIGVAPTETPEAALYELVAAEGRWQFAHRATGTLIQQAKRAAALLPALKQVALWERTLALSNRASALEAAVRVEFVCTEVLKDGGEHVYQGREVTLECPKEGAGWAWLHGRLKVRHHAAQTLHLLLVYFSPEYGVYALFNEPVPPGDAWITLYGDGDDHGFHLGDGAHEEIDRFKLIASTEKVDDFLLVQADLELGATVRDGGDARERSIGGVRRIGHTKPLTEQWLTRDLIVHVVGRLDTLGPAGWASPNGRVRIKGHPQFTAAISLGAAPAESRSAEGGLRFDLAFARAGLELVNLAGTRGGSADCVLELSGIMNAAALAQQPLQIELDLPLAADEGLLAFVTDGEHVLPAGRPWRDEQGLSHLAVDDIPDAPVSRRSLGRALKMYFFKTYLRRNDVNLLRRVVYRDDGSAERRSDNLDAHVAAANRVLLLMHGIIGDTEGMAEGVRTCGVAQEFDLVLTYDYENLATPIAQTARLLKLNLEAVGLHADDGRHLTLLVHSMGGLVARWFVEREGGGALVDHLVMCGTPNAGSPFGKVGDARRVATMLGGLAANVAPALLAWVAPLLFALNRSEKVTLTLEQMGPASEFIRDLNASADPCVRYTVLAGDVGRYDDDGDPLFVKLVAKLGRSATFDALFGGLPNDIAVSVPSIVGVGMARLPAPVTMPVASHHLNYFSSPAGQAALRAVGW